MDTARAARPLTPFFALWTGQALSLIGTNAVQFAIIWWLTARTGSATVLAGATFLGILPQIVLGPFVGAWVDRWNRKRIMLLADAVSAIASVVLALMFYFESVGTAQVLLLLLVRAIAGGFHAPAMIASTTLMVPEEHLTRIQGMNQAVQGGQLIVSAPFGALLFAWLPMGGVMLVDVATALLAIVPLWFIHVPQPERSDDGAAGASTWQDVLSGIRYLRARRGHVTLLAMSAAINLLMVPAFTLLPLLVVELGRGALGLGGMSSLFGAGTLAGGILLGVWGGFRKRIRTTLAGLLAFGLATLALGAAPTFAAALVALAAVGVAVPLVNGPIHAILQTTVAADYQGRVFTLYGSVCTAMTPVGLALAAPVAETLGVRVWYLAGGALCVALGALGLFLPSLSQMEQGAAAAPAPVA